MAVHKEKINKHYGNSVSEAAFNTAPSLRVRSYATYIFIISRSQDEATAWKYALQERFSAYLSKRNPLVLPSASRTRGTTTVWFSIGLSLGLAIFIRGCFPTLLNFFPCLMNSNI